MVEPDPVLAQQRAAAYNTMPDGQRVPQVLCVADWPDAQNLLGLTSPRDGKLGDIDVVVDDLQWEQAIDADPPTAASRGSLRLYKLVTWARGSGHTRR